ncbi:TPA: hypothetical protein VPC71_000635 [Streptococcus pyogenes]|uniref:Uncharacterized protein n=3 Tax=Streptococcus pyogenes TaxID=1314 RepID=Q9A168_STRP1|nr:hypothetical protein [Streptococcus pyogenes]EPZ41897.1 hypothetical protein HMPREF1228_1409 [Streptococcus pyogenes GA41345]HEP6223534.1 hypothetical protein [Streptococcus pyogenes ABC020014327]HEP6226841.1 hypothetical protein [Streptococcus pyogenes ABC020056369]HEP6228634.1 hypothetical protein [Streptococcus pyogenes ABC020013891]HEP6229949.1 hypothetical protein [Streptococcus pyogenes ABC020041419]HEP6232072.1 hypothetical protein [Streptococcus pyogenes ABC020060258]HEP6238896.1 
MKKTLTLLLALFAIGVTSSVRAEDEQNKFILDGLQEKVKEVSVSDFSVGESKIKVWLPQAWSVKISREHSPKSSISNSGEQKPLSNSSENKEGQFSKRLPYGTQHTIKLSSQLTKGERVTLTFRDEDFWGAGYCFYRDSLSIKEDKQYEEEIKKIEDDLERQDLENDALEMFKKQTEREANKPWHQRLSENIQDQWWNFKGLFQ